MANDNKSREWLYKTLDKEGYNVGKDYAEFDSLMSNNADSRKWVFDTMSGLGYNVGKDYDEFEGLVNPLNSEPADVTTSSPSSQLPQAAQPNHDAKESVNAAQGLSNMGFSWGQKSEKPTEKPVAWDRRAEKPADVPTEKPVEKTETDAGVADNPFKFRLFDRRSLADRTFDRMNARYEAEQAYQQALDDMNPLRGKSPYKKEEAKPMPKDELVQRIDKGEAKPFFDVPTNKMEAEAIKTDFAVNKQLREHADYMNRKAYEEGYRENRKTILDYASKIDEQFKESYDKDRMANASSFYGVQSAARGEVGSRLLSPATRDLAAAKAQMDSAKKIVENATRNKSDRNGFLGFFEDSAINFKDAITDFDTWDFGMKSMEESQRVRDVLDKFDKGAQLSKSEQALLDAVAMNTAANLYYSQDQGMGATVGETTGHMIPFMLQIAVSPTTGLGKMAASKVFKSLARWAAKSAAKKMAAQGAKYGTRLLTDLGSGYLMAGSVGLGHTLADAERRMTGTPVLMQTEGIHYGGREKGDDALSAYGKAFTSHAIEYQSEMVGEYFKPLQEMAGRFIVRGAANSNLGMLSDILRRGVRTYQRYGATPVAKFFDAVNNYTRYDGAVAEYVEEIVGNVENAAIVGDMEFNAGEQGIFNPEHNLETFLSVAVPGFVQSAFKTGAYYGMKGAKVLADKKASSLFGEDIWSSIKEEMDAFTLDMTAEEMNAALNGIAKRHDIRTADELKAMMRYNYFNLSEKALDMGVTLREEDKAAEMEDVVEGSKDAGSEMSTPEEVHAAFVDESSAAASLMSTERGTSLKERIDEMLSLNASAGELSRLVNDADVSLQDAANAYIRERAKNIGIEERIADEVRDAVENERTRMMPFVADAETGQMNPVIYQGSRGYIVGAEGEALSVLFDGAEEPVTILATDAEVQIERPVFLGDYLASYEQAISERKRAELEQSRVNHPNTKVTPVIGEVIQTPLGNRRVAFVNGEGNVFLEEDIMELNEETGQLEPKHQKEFRGEDAVSMSDYIQMQNDYWNGIDAEQKSADEAKALADESAENKGRNETVSVQVALEYLLEGGRGSIENAGYFLHGIQAAFPHINSEIQAVRDATSSEELGMAPDAWVASNPQALQDIRALVSETYGEEGVKLFDSLLANSTGFYPREGKAVGQAIDNLSPVPAKDGTGYKLSDEIDENGRQFVLNSEGEISFGMITEETNLPPAPILLSEGIITNPVTNDGYGLVHIEARHGEQIRNAGYKDVVSFIEDVARNYEFIREGVKRDGHQTYMLQLTDKHNNTLMVELSGDGTYWNINTAGIFKTSYGRNRKEVYNRHTTDKQSAETAEASLSGEQSGTTPSTSMNAPTSSADKGTTISETSKEKAEKKLSKSEFLSSLGEVVSMRDWLMRKLYGGGVKLIWKDSDTSNTRGLGAHLGLLGSERERRKRIWALGNKDKGGLYPEEAAEKLLAAYADEMGWTGTDGDFGIDSQDVLNELLDIIATYPKKSLLGEAVLSLRHNEEDMMSEEEMYAADKFAEEVGFTSYEEYEAYYEMIEAYVGELSAEEYGYVYNQIGEDIEYFLSLQQQKQSEENGNERTTDGRVQGSSSALPDQRQGEDRRTSTDNQGEGQGEDQGIRGEGSGDLQEGDGDSVDFSKEGKENVSKKTRSLPLSEGEYADMRQAEILRDNPDMDEVDAYNMAIDEFPSYIKEKVDSGELAELFGKLSIGEQIELVKIIEPAGYSRADISTKQSKQQENKTSRVGEEVHIRNYDGTIAFGKIISHENGEIIVQSPKTGIKYNVTEDRILKDVSSDEVVFRQGKRSSFTRAVEKRAEQWRKSGIKVNIIRNFDDVENTDARAAIEAGETVAGWYDVKTGEAYIYLPHNADSRDVDETIIHEVLSHKGLRGLLGEEGYNALCDKVWEVMHPADRIKFLAYPGVKGDKRAAADEFIAHLAEQERLKPEQQTVWNKIVDFFLNLFNSGSYTNEAKGILSKSSLTRDDISRLIRLSYAEMKRDGNANVKGNEGRRFRISDNAETAVLNSKQKKDGADLIGDDVRFKISKNNKATISGWLNKRSDLTDAERESFMDYIEEFDASKQLATAKWFANGAIRVPEDMPKVDQAMQVAKKAKVDALQYKNPMELIDAHADIKVKEKPINPDEVSTLSDRREIGNGIVTYLVEESDESRENMRRIINTHFGKDSSPWCLLQGDEDGELTSDSEYYWGNYSAYPKRVAFKDGKLTAFSANDVEDVVWWDRMDRSHAGIPVIGKIPNDEQGRSATIIYDNDGNVAGMTDIHKGNRNNGLYESWHDNGKLRERANYKDGKRDGLVEVWNKNGQLWVRINYKDGEYDGLREENYYNDSKLFERANFKDGKRDGLTERYFHNGSLKERLNFKNNKLDGLYESWNEDGELTKMIFYKDGKPIQLDVNSGEVTRFSIKGETLEEVNRKFNARLLELDKDREQKDRVLRLGKPSKFLLDGGVVNADIEMEFDRFVRKSSEDYKSNHPFTANDIMDLPMAINAPIAVFDSTNGKDKVILTELKKDGRNFVVAIKAIQRKRKGGVTLEVNEIATLYPKEAKGIVNWINNGFVANADKNKTLEWLGALRTNHGTELNNQELISAAKVIQDFENPKLSGEKISEEPKFSLTEEESRDQEYADAVAAGETEKVQKMVDKAAKDAGYTIRAYHGTARKDRVGNVFRPERATSGPMAFFTDSREIAENYSHSKSDTSVGYDSDYDDYETQFRAKHKKTGKDYSIWNLWGFLPFSERAKLAEQAGHIREDWDGDGDVIYDPETKDGNGAFRNQVKDYHGNVLRALVYHWLKSGQLWKKEADFLKVLEKAGVNEALDKLGFEMPRYLDPEYREEGVYDVYLKMENPFDATEMIDEKFIQGFEEFAAEHEDEYVQESKSTDSWDKNDVTAEDFAENMRKDIENGRTDAWTAIPDVATAYLKSLGFDGIKDKGGKYVGSVHTVYVPFSSEQVKSAVLETYDDAGNLIPLSERFNESKNDIRFRTSNQNQLGFVSNAMKAVEDIKQEKATPEQWLKMIEKQGGLKAGEDKWLGLSDWLKSSDKKTLTKEDLLEFIGENMIQIEEVKYGGNAEYEEKLSVLNDEFIELIDEGEDATGSMYTSDWVDYAWDAMADRYGDDFRNAFTTEGRGTASRLVPEVDYDGNLTGEAKYYLDIEHNPINSTRMEYTTEGLDNKREIALTVPTIESWNESDMVHFGDAGEGRAVAWVRFGETVSYDYFEDVQVVGEFHEPQTSSWSSHTVYRPIGNFKRGDYIVYGKGRSGNMIYVVYINDNQIPVGHTTLEDARTAMNEYYKEHPRKSRKANRVLVIDEIQSKRHQEGRERGYIKNAPGDAPALIKYEAAKKAHDEYLASLREKYGRDDVSYGLTKEEEKESSRLWREKFEANIDYNKYLNENHLGNFSDSDVPDAPFDKNWHELAMKRMLRLAAEEGFDKVAWTKGEQQAVRYDIGSSIDHIDASPSDIGVDAELVTNGGGYITLSVEESGTIRTGGYGADNFAGKPLSDVVGKELAAKILSTTEDNTRYEGEDLRIGGEGMKGFYDQILPRFMNKYGKKWGVKVEEVELPELEDSARKMWSVDVTDAMKDSVMEGQTMFRIKDEVDRWRDKYGGAPIIKAGKGTTVEDLIAEGLFDIDAESVLDAMNNEAFIAVYLEDSDKIVIFDALNDKEASEVEATLFHENVHAILSDMELSQRDALVDAFWNRYENKELKNFVNRYPEHKRKEEYFVYAMDEALSKGDFDNILASAGDDYIIGTEVNNILNALNYDREQEAITRRESGKDVLGETEFPVRLLDGSGDKGTQAEGASRAESQEGLEPLSETDPLKRAEQIRFRERSVSNRLQSAVEMYEEAVMVASGRGFLEMIKDKTYFGRVRNEFVEAWVSGIRSVKAIQNAIERSTGKKIEGYEDVYSSLNAKSSMDGIEAEMVKQHFILPLMTHVAEMTKGKTLDGKPIDMDDVEIYMNAVHGIERNKRMAERELDAYVERMAEEHSLSKEEKEALRQESASKFRKDYSGLTELFKRPDDKRVTIKSLEKRAHEYAEMFEAAVGKENADKMWKLVGALTDYSLEKSYNSGIISKKQYEDTKSMYEHYIPLRGWHDNYAGDVYQYITRGARDVMQRTLRTARGRTSRAGDIFGTMEMMAVSAIMEGNKNLVKQKFYHLARNTGKDTGLLMVTDLWYEKNANGEIVPVENPNLHDDMTAEEMRQAIEEHEERMNELKEEGKVFKMRSRDKFGKQFPLHMKKWQEQNHAVRVLLGGEEKLVYVLGNPRAAMAINGLLSKDAEKDENKFVKMQLAFMRFLSAAVTSFSPEFLVGNFERDVQDALTTIRIKEGRKGARRFAKNYVSLVGKDRIFKLISAYKKGELDMSNPTHRYFKEFMDNGGMTGVGSIYDEKRYQREMQDMMAQMQRGMLDAPRKVVKGFFNWVEFVNQGVENGTRFAGYMSSRQSGKSITESIYDSKELTTNFNMKGSGAWGNLWVRRYILFANPAIQSLRKMYELATGHPMRFLGTKAITITMGFVTALLNYLAAAFVGDGDDDDNDYWKLNSWNRYNYINIYTGNGFLHVSIPHDQRPFWTLGNLIFDHWAGRITTERAIQSELAALFNLSPIAFYEGGSDTDDSIWKGLLKGITPSVLKPFTDVYGWNEDFMGGRITGQTDFNKHLPEWQRVTGESPQFMYDLSRAFNEATGGRHNKKSWADSEVLNPDALWYLIKSFTGGIGQMATRAVKMVEQIRDQEQELDWRNVPFVPKFYVGVGTQSAKNRVVNDKFWLYWTEYKAADKELSKNTKDAAAGLITEDEVAKTIEERKSDGTYQSWYKMEHSGLVSLYDYATEVEDDDLKQQVKKWAVDLIEKGIEPSYGEVFDASSDAETRKALGKAIAQKNGTTDEYGKKPNKDAKEETRNAALIYQEERTSHDVEEDTRLMKMQQDAEDAGDESLRDYIKGKRGEVNEKRQRLGKPSVGIAEGMTDVRDKRTKAFENIEKWKKDREKKEKETE